LRARYGRALDPDALREEIARAVAAGELEEIPGEVRPVPLAIKKDRFLVLLAAVDGHGGTRELIGKGYWDDRAQRVLRNQRVLWDGGLGAGSDVRTSRPWGLIRPLGVFVMERVPGRPAAPGDRSVAAATGRAAARLHSCAAALEPAFGLQRALDNVERHARLLARREPSAGSQALRLADRARELSVGMRFETDAPVNGDLSVDSFLVHGATTYIIDWDLGCRFDSAWDVGHHLGQLARLGLERELDVAPLREAFIAAYNEARATTPEFERRVHLFEAVTCVHKAYTVRRVEGTGWRRVLPGLLALAEANLATLA
jgi:hypothetical protein